jgi:beta-propeller repeat-containing protein
MAMKTIPLPIVALVLAAGILVAGVAISRCAAPDPLNDANAICCGATDTVSIVDPAARTEGEAPRPMFSKLALAFEANEDQGEPGIGFVARGRGYSLQVSASGAAVSLIEPPSRKDPVDSFSSPAGDARQDVVALRMNLAGANPVAGGSALERLRGRINYFLGTDSQDWRSDIPTFAKVRYDDVYPGIDLVYYGNQRQLEYDFIVTPSGDPKAIKIEFEGADDLTVDPVGDLLLRRAGTTVLRLQKPSVYQDTSEGRRQIAAAYDLNGGQVSFQIGEYDVARPLVIDPVLHYATRLGGSDADAAYAIAVGPGGDVFVTGETSSTNFPGTSVNRKALGRSTNAFVAKLSADGSHVLYVTYLGGSDADVGYGIAVDRLGNAYITGDTRSADFPLMTPWQTKLAGAADVFVAKLSPDGSQLLYSTYVGGSAGERGLSIAVDPAGNAYVTGYTNSTDFPVHNPFQPAFAGGNADGFVLKLKPDGSAPVYATYLGGGNDRPDIGTSIAADAAGNAYVTGFTNSVDFPTVHPLQPFRGPTDGFVTKFNPDGSALVYSTHLGGTADDEAMGIAIDAEGNAYVTGHTESPNFPTTAGAFRTGCVAVAANLPIGNICSGGDAFVSKLSSDGTKLVYSTFLNGSGFEVGRSIAIGADGSAHITGLTNSRDFPTVNPVQEQFGGGAYDAFVAKLNPGGSALIYSTFLGGSGADGGYGITVDAAGDAWVGGYTTSSDFPLRRPLRSSLARASGDDKDSFLAKISDMPAEHHH